MYESATTLMPDRGRRGTLPRSAFASSSARPQSSMTSTGRFAASHPAARRLPRLGNQTQARAWAQPEPGQLARRKAAVLRDNDLEALGRLRRGRGVLRGPSVSPGLLEGRTHGTRQAPILYGDGGSDESKGVAVARPLPTRLYHFTSIDHLETIVQHGLLADTTAAASGLITVEVGNRGIKERRRRRVVPVGPRGMVADYTPFYFAPRSPMMFAISKGRVPEYQHGTESLLYLGTTVERLAELGLSTVFTDRNAVLEPASYSDQVADLDDMIDWELMEARYWADTPEEPDRRERRMAELLVHRSLPWEAIQYIAAYSEARAAEAQATLARSCQGVRVGIEPDWYFT